MKKIYLGGVAAICAAVGLYSFKTRNVAGPYYFKVNCGVNILAGGGECLVASEVTYIASISDADCIFTSYLCVVTFATRDLTSGHEHVLSGICAAVRSTVATRGRCD